jgi:hypothetical protein
MVGRAGLEIDNSLIFSLGVGGSIMQPLYTESELKAAKSRQRLPLRCLHCLETFFKSKHDIQNILSLKRNKRESGDFCSNVCQNQHQDPPIFVLCEQCGISFKKQLSQIKKSKHNFCCRSCGAKYNNAHKTKGTRISKLEKWLSTKLPLLYPNLEFHFNRKDTINGELDIFIPSLKLAFELNGIFHYEPIYGPEKLASIQNNDTRKSQACLERSIELCLIDVSHETYFKEQRAIKFLQIIQNIITLRLSGSSPISDENLFLASTT